MIRDPQTKKIQDRIGPGPITYKNSREEKSRTRLDRDHKFQEILDKFGQGLDQKSRTSSDLNQHISRLKDRLRLGPKSFESPGLELLQRTRTNEFSGGSWIPKYDHIMVSQS